MLAFYHGWRGVDSDYIGGYELPDLPPVAAIDDYRASYEAMLRQTLANIDAAASEATQTDALAWARARQDAEARLEAFLADDIPIVAVRVSATAQLLVSWAETRGSQVRRIDQAQRDLPIVLPWR